MTEASPTLGGWQRMVVATLAGLAVTIVVVLVGTLVAVKLALSGVDPATLERRLEQGFRLPSAYLALNLAFTGAAALAGGYIAARIARRRGAKAVRLLAAVLLLSGVLSLTSGEPAPGQPAWYPVVLMFLGPVSALVGGSLPRDARPRDVAACR